MTDKAQKLDALRNAIFRGDQARAMIEQLDSRFEKIREDYRSGLVAAIRGKADDQEIRLLACRIASLEDLYEELYQQARTGARAQQAADEIERESKAEASKDERTS